MSDDSESNDSFDISDGDDEDVLAAPSETKMCVVDYTSPRFGDPFARKEASPAFKRSCGTTIVGVQLKNALGTYLAAYGNNAQIHCLGEPVYMLATCAGDALWAYPILSHVEAMAKSKKWTSENCAVYTNMFLNSNYEPNRRIWGLPSKSNIKETSCVMLFASSIPNKNKVKENEYDSQLWLGNCKRSFKHGDSDQNMQNSVPVACYGSGARYAKSLLEADGDEIASGNMCHEEVLIKLLEAFKSTSENGGTSGNILVYYVASGNFVKLHDGHVDKVNEDIKALKETIERKRADLQHT